MRYLHLLDASSPRVLPDGALASITLLQRLDPDNEHRLVCFASPAAIRRARVFGVRIDSVFGVPAKRLRTAQRLLRHWISRDGSIDRIQPWTAQTESLAFALADLAEPSPPAPGDSPLIPEHSNPSIRRRHRDRFGLRDDEIAITLLDPNRTSAGAFGLAIAPLTCAVQDRTLVGLIPGERESEGATRAKRYADNAGNSWRIELIAGPLHAVATAADAILYPTRANPADPWSAYSSTDYALACAQACSIPVITGSFGPTDPAPDTIANAFEQDQPGRVNIVRTLHDVVNGTINRDAHVAGRVRAAHETTLVRRDPNRWIERWRSVQGVATTVD